MTTGDTDSHQVAAPFIATGTGGLRRPRLDVERCSRRRPKHHECDRFNIKCTTLRRLSAARATDRRMDASAMPVCGTLYETFAPINPRCLQFFTEILLRKAAVLGKQHEGGGGGERKKKHSTSSKFEHLLTQLLRRSKKIVEESCLRKKAAIIFPRQHFHPMYE